MALENATESRKPADTNAYADLGGMLDHAKPQSNQTVLAADTTKPAPDKVEADSKGVPCTGSDSSLKGLNAQQLQDEINVTMASRGYVFKKPEVGERIQKEMGNRQIEYKPNPNFNEETDLTDADKQRVSDIQKQKTFLNYSGDACTANTDPNNRQHAKSGKEFLPDSDKKEIGVEDIKKLAGGDGSVSLEQLRAARNEIFMRAGRPFASQDLRDYASKEGYRPRNNYSDNDLNAAEKKNAKLLVDVESAMKANGLPKVEISVLDQIAEKMKK